MKCFDIFSSNRIFLSRGKRGVQPAQICLCLIKGCNFLFISGPLPPTPSSRLLIPTLQNAPTVPPNPGALLLVSCLPTLQPAPLRAGVWGGYTLCVSRLVAERQQILIVPRGSGDRGGGWEGWRRHRCLVSIQSHIYTRVYVYRTHGPARAQRGLHSSKLGTKVHPEHRSHLHNRCLPELISQSTSDNRTRSTKNPKKHKESLEFTLSVCQHRTL